MLRALLILAWLPGCVIEDPDGWFDGDDSDEERSLWVEPQQVPSGSTSAVTITDDWRNTDFRDVWDARPLGEFEVLEWSARRDALELVIRPDAGVHGEQVLALDHPDWTAYATFEVD